MRSIVGLSFVAGIAVALAGCGAGHQKAGPTVTVTVTVSPHGTAPANPPSSSQSATTMNERLFADGEAQSISVIPASVVAGAVMRAYAQFQHAYGAADAAVGQPDSSESVTPIAAGFKLCATDSSGASSCEAYTQFTTNNAGQITGVSVNGEPVAGRIATAPEATSDGLRISDVVAYRLTDAQNQVAVAFKLTDSSYRPVNTNPALLASFNGASDETQQEALPATLAPGDSLYAVAGFGVTQITGLFCLQPNDGFGEHLPCTTLSKV